MGKRKRQPHAPRPAARKGVQAAAARLAWVPGALARMLLALCGVYGAVFGLAQGFALETDVRLVAAFCVGAVAVCLLVPAAVRLVRRGRPQRRLWARKGCLFAAWAAVLALWAWGVPPVCLGFRLLCARITQEYRLYYAWVPQWYPEMLSAGAAQARGLYTVFLCWLALLAAGLVCMALAAKKRALWGILATAVPFCLRARPGMCHAGVLAGAGVFTAVSCGKHGARCPGGAFGPAFGAVRGGGAVPAAG